MAWRLMSYLVVCARPGGSGRLAFSSMVPAQDALTGRGLMATPGAKVLVTVTPTANLLPARRGRGAAGGGATAINPCPSTCR
ncbi:hypothetical protein GDO81_029520 [Engystomops pustulosus]|uniref:Uncharacterized protein n=1 Tax=Engystomops pustulosus TaxID=76066 RepID=A0AAV6YCM1_ENGPU|nr:hypothetical protein GDO81_029520 [Engystomops pustulosus]